MIITNLKEAVNAFLKRKEDAVLVPEIPKKELHDSMHNLIKSHHELLARINENHELLQKMKQNQGMGRQKAYVWEEIQADRKIASRIVGQIKEIKSNLFGDQARNMGGNA